MSNRKSGVTCTSTCLLPLVILCLTTLSFITFCSHTQLDAEGHIELRYVVLLISKLFFLYLVLVPS